MKRESEALPHWDAVVVGSGPNGLSAALELGRRGRRVLVLERAPVPGGGLDTRAGPIAGCLVDHCATVFPLARASPCFAASGIVERLPWIESPAVLAHPLGDGTTVLLWRDVERTAAELGCDERGYAALFRPLVDDAPQLLATLLGPAPGLVRFPGSRLPARALLRFARSGLRSVASLSRQFRSERTRALVAGLAAHSTLPLEWAPSAAFALVLAIAGHRVGWPLLRGGAVTLGRALAEEVARAGGSVECSFPVERLADVPPGRSLVLDVAPPAALALAGERWPLWYRRTLRSVRPGPGVFKVDWLVRQGIPWQDERCRLAATVHVGGAYDEIAAAERAVALGRVPERPFVILVQASRFDRSRTIDGVEVVWGYCHVPNGWSGDLTAAIEAQVERFAPGFRERIVARRTWEPRELARANPNLVGGDLTGGWPTLGQLFARPAGWPWPPYCTPDPAIFLASAATPPGGGVHGMCGYWAAQQVERWLARLDRPHAGRGRSGRIDANGRAHFRPRPGPAAS
ncbi:MAG: NAD(P)/FAD-dependent oxidoreductase [Thermomicrobium sp.]|nr:NAD(P)/FAD-dependent oxidoreductase [Thermomicrobium sp.]